MPEAAATLAWALPLAARQRRQPMGMAASPAPTRRAAVGLVVALGHGLLAWAWLQGLGSHLPPGARLRPLLHTTQPPLIWLDLRPMGRPSPQPMPEPAQQRLPQAATTTAPGRRTPALAKAPLSAVNLPAESPVATAAPSPTVSPVDVPASAPRLEPLLGTEATRRAIRQAAQAPLLSERSAAATGIHPATSAQRLEQAASAAGRGDCVKGDYPGAGMGLLSLPFLAAGALGGQCAR